MKLKTFWILTLVIVFLVVVIKNIPAQLGLGLANLPVQMSGVSGTVWRGKAESVVLPIENSAYALGRVEWALSPWSLLTVKPCAKLRSKLDNQELSGKACAGLNGSLQLEDAQFAVPAKVAEIFAPIVEVDGEFLMHVEALEVNNNQIHKLNGSGSWDSARFYNSTSWVGLGSIGFDFNEDGNGGVQAKIFDIDSPMEMQLDSQFNFAGDYNTVGEIKLKPNAPREIGELLDNYTNVSREVQEVLSLFVERKGQNGYSIRWVNAQD